MNLLFKISFIVVIFLCSCSSAKNITEDTIKLGNNAEITLKRTENGNNVGFHVETADPVLLRTLLMQGFYLPMCGAGIDTTNITFPSAKDVSNQIEHHPGEVKATLKGNREKRPDIRPLVAALKKADVKISRSGHNLLSPESHDVSINPANGTLSYHVTVPKNYISGDYKVITLVSVPNHDMNISTEFTSNRHLPNKAQPHMQPFGVNANGTDNKMRNRIKIEFRLKK